VQVVM